MTTLRLFVALYPTADAAGAMLRALSRLDLPPVATYRATRAEQVHMTVQFIGDTEAASLPEVEESVRRSAAGVGAFALVPQKLTMLPERGPPRLVAAVTDAPPALLEVQRRLAQRLARSPRARAGDGFLPHFTLCRFTGGARAPRMEAPLRGEAFRVSDVVLVRSILRPSGAEHVEVMRVPLAA